MADQKTEKCDKKIIVTSDGPYHIEGDVPLVHKTQIVTQDGEPILWKKDGDILTPASYELCRCGHSKDKPFCDGSHFEVGFDGTETANTNTNAERREDFGGPKDLKVSYDGYICMNSGFCANRFTDIANLLPKGENPNVRVQIISMVDNCPSGSYTKSLKEGQPDVEPDLPCQIAVTTEITSTGPVMGPLWVTGEIPVERSDGKPFETRNRVTLCRCGRSMIKPLCDGTHRSEHVTED